MTQLYVSRGQYAGYEVIAKVGSVYQLDATLDANGQSIIMGGGLFDTEGGLIQTGAGNVDTEGGNVLLGGGDITEIDDIFFVVNAAREIRQNAGSMQLRMETGAVLDVVINSNTEYSLTPTTLDMGQNILSNVSLIQGITTSNDIDDTTAGWLYSVGSGDTHRFEVNSSVRFEVGDNTIGFYGATPASKPTITGSRGGNAALADLLTELATLGLITDSSSA